MDWFSSPFVGRRPIERVTMDPMRKALLAILFATATASPQQPKSIQRGLTPEDCYAKFPKRILREIQHAGHRTRTRLGRHALLHRKIRRRFAERGLADTAKRTRLLRSRCWTTTETPSPICRASREWTGPHRCLGIEFRRRVRAGDRVAGFASESRIGAGTRDSRQKLARRSPEAGWRDLETQATGGRVRSAT